jgi:predicted glycoside hydrolase/deacetylase ChbG (UPF0249 family)
LFADDTFNALADFELKLLASPAAREVLAQEGVQLISYHDLLENR